MGENKKSIIKTIVEIHEDYLELWKTKKIIAAIVTIALFMMVLPWILGVYAQFVALPNRSKIISNKEAEIKELQGKIQDMSTTHTAFLNDKNHRILELEAELTPFRTVALQKYGNADVDALKKLADYVSELNTELSTMRMTIREMNLKETEKELHERYAKIFKILPNGQKREMLDGAPLKGGHQIITTSDQYSLISSGILYLARGENEKAKDRFVKVVKEVPEWPYSYFYLASITNNSQFLDLAMNQIQAMNDLGYDDWEMRYLKSMIMTFYERYEESEEMIDEIIENKIEIDSHPGVFVYKNTPQDLRAKFQIPLQSEK